LSGRGRLVASTARLPDEAVHILEGVGASVEVMGRGEDPGRWLREAAERADVILLGFHRLGPEALRPGVRVRLVVAMSSGVDHIDLEAAERAGVCVANQPEAIAEAVAEHTLTLILAALRRVVEGHFYASTGRWASEGGFLRGRTLRGRTLGVVGLGRIGSLVALKARLMGASRILYWSRRRKRELEQILHAEPASLERLFSESDVVVVALPAARETRGLVGWSLLSRLKSGAVLVNVGRGVVVDESALERLLSERDDVVVALDVFSEEPLSPDSPIARLAREAPGRVILTPHIAGGSDLSLWATRYMAARQAAMYLERGEVWNPVAGPCREARDIPGLWRPIDSWSLQA
jgi:glyoxylate reductase